MTDWRAALGCRFLEVAEASRGMLRELQQGRSVGLLMDQRYDRGVAVPFFGLPAPTTVVPARLALRLVQRRIQKVQAWFSVERRLPVFRPGQRRTGPAAV